LVKNISKVIIVAACAVLALAACSAHGLHSPRSFFQASTASWLNYDPQAEVQDPISVHNSEIQGYQGWEGDGYKLVAVGASLEPATLPDGLSVSAEDGALSISLSKPASGSVYLYAFYPDDVHPSEMAAGAAINDGQIFLAVSAGDNAVAIGIAPITGDVPSGEIARISFEDGANAISKASSAAPTNDKNQVTDLAVSVNGSGGITATWTEIHKGDYDNNGMVGVSDVTPLAMMYNQRIDTTTNPGRFALVDGDGNEIIGVADVTPIAMNFNTLLAGYDVYRTQLSSAAENPDVNDTGRWTYINRLGATPPDQKPSVLREFNSQDFRLPYTFSDAPTVAAYYAYYVRPFSQESDSPNEGPISFVAKTSQPTGMPTLTLEVMNGPFFFLDTDVVMRVNLEDATGAFAVNAWIEYRKDVLQYVSSSPSYPGYDDNLFFDVAYGGDPLFLGWMRGASLSDPANFDVVAFNASKRSPAATVSGTGPVAYFVFHVIGGSGPYDEAFRFPQGTTNIWVWGSQYGVALPGPQLGQAAMVNITS
jgi:hypothetical protein